MSEKHKTVKPPFDGELQAHLGTLLRRLFNETAAQPVPDRFVDLLDRLDRVRPAPARSHASEGRADPRDHPDGAVVSSLTP